MSNSSIWPIDRTFVGTTTLGPGSDVNEEILHILQSSSITGASASDCLVSNPGQSLGGWDGGSYPFPEIQLVYFTATADWASKHLCWTPFS